MGTKTGDHLSIISPVAFSTANSAASASLKIKKKIVNLGAQTGLKEASQMLVSTSSLASHLVPLSDLLLPPLPS